MNRKKAFYDRLTIFRIKTVMRGIMKAWRGRVFQRILKQKKIRLAEEFREDRQALWTQPQENKKVTFFLEESCLKIIKDDYCEISDAKFGV